MTTCLPASASKFSIKGRVCDNLENKVIVYKVSMEHLHLRLRMLLPFVTHVLLLCMSSQRGLSATTSGNESDRLALLAFKDRITHDPLRILSSWNDSIHFCYWTGITCSRKNQRVEMLSLSSQKLLGPISPTIGNLTFLTGVNLGNNSFSGEIPQELGLLSRLRHLDLTYNSLGGEIPINLTHCLHLRDLDLVYNHLIGNIPTQLSSLTKLVSLGLGSNNLTGDIPLWIGNFSSLIAISLAQNSLHGSIPDDFGRLSKLQIFKVYDNNLSGTIPPSLYNISSISFFSVTVNRLHGRLPPNVGLTLPNLRVFAGGVNSFEGPIPVSLSNVSNLRVLDFAENGLTGPVPLQFGSLRSLNRLSFGSNRLGKGKAGDHIGDILSALSNCTSLEVLGLEYNFLGGKVPDSIANLSTLLSQLTIGANLIHGNIPVGIENLVSLTILAMEGNFFTGHIPFVIGKLQKLGKLYLNLNMLSGLIPSSLGNLTLLNFLYMQDNSLEGNIPPSLGNCQNLLVLNISHNNLSGTIPKEVVSLSSLAISFSVRHNSLTGSLPSEVGSMINLGELDVSENKLSGQIPTSLANCIRLERIRMEGNIFQGSFPQSLKELRGIQEIDLSRNKFSGEIPEYLMNLSSLRYLNLSYNNFTGEVPKQGIFANASAISMIGNNHLCGGIIELHLPECPKQAPRTSGASPSRKVIASVTTVVVLLIMLSFFCALCWIRKLKRKSADTAKYFSEDSQSGVTYSELFRSTNEFSPDCLIGEGSFSSVYRGVIRDNKETVAVKVLNLQQHGASRSFIAECQVLKNIRHRNLVKIITACSSMDYKGNEFKALIMEFMPNGSLDDWLHPNVGGKHQSRCLTFTQRLNIAIDVASALEYLHHHSETPIAHCDLKPSNVLLDEEMTAHVGDFGLAKFLFESTNNSANTVSVGLKGSIGYLPPEYGMGGHVSILGDIYSYGILLLEMFTGKRPTDEMFKDGLSLYNFAVVALPDRVMEIIDPLMPSEAQKEDQEEDEKKGKEEEAAIINEERSRSKSADTIEECLFSLFTIGLSCSVSSPRKRIAMGDVVRKMHDVRDSFLRCSM